MADLYTFDDLRAFVLRTLDEGGDTGTTQALAGDYINAAHIQRCTEMKWSFLRWPRAITFSTVVDQQVYALHENFDSPLYFYNQTSKFYLEDVPARTIAPDEFRWNDDTGSARHFLWQGFTGVQNQPSSNSTLVAVSTSTADTTQTLVVRGTNASDVIISETLTLNGTTNVTSTNTFKHVEHVTKSANTTGTVTLTSNAGGVTLISLLPTQLGKQYRQIFLVEKPTAVETIEYQFFKAPRKLSAANDVPDIPYPYSLVLAFDALMLFAGYNTDLRSLAISVWAPKQEALDGALYEAYRDDNSIASRTQGVRYVGREAGWAPRINR